MNDLRVEHVRLGLENSVAFTRAKPFPVQVTADSLRFLWVKRLEILPQTCKSRGSFNMCVLSILGTCCDLPCYSKSDIGPERFFCSPFYNSADP